MINEKKEKIEKLEESIFKKINRISSLIFPNIIQYKV